MALALNHFGTPAAGDAAVAFAAAGTAMVRATALAPPMRRSTRLADVIMFASRQSPVPLPGNGTTVWALGAAIRPKRRTTAIT
jgi:hypothetical protein